MGELTDRIFALKKSLNAVIVAHNYEVPEVQDIADFTGDSLELSRKCVEVDADVIVFCGVHFMAETAAILNPERTVLLSEANAGCPMADMIDVDSLREWKARYPQATVVCYVNSTAAVKAESDICCTSANAVMVIGGLDNEEVLEVTNRLSSSFIIRTTPLRSLPVIFLISSLPLTNPSEERKPIAKYYIVHRRFQEFFSWSSEKPLPVPTTMRYFY